MVKKKAGKHLSTDDQNAGSEEKDNPAEKKYIRGAVGTNPSDINFQSSPDGVKEILGNDGISEAFILHRAATDTNLRDSFSSETPETFWTFIQDTLDDCDAIMLAHGWDRKAGNGRNFPSMRDAEPFSEFWYAGIIGHDCWFMIRFYKPKNPDTWILREVFDLGAKITEADWRLKFRPAIKTGLPVNRGGKLGGEMRAKKFKPQTHSIIGEMRRLQDGGHSIKRSAEITAQKGLGTSAEGNRKLWARHAIK